MAFNEKKDFGKTRNRKLDTTSLVFGKVPPQAPDLEKAVLGAIMLEREKIALVLEIIKDSSCFYIDSNQKIYESIQRLVNKGMPEDLLTITEELRKTEELEIVGGAHYLTRLTMSVVSSANVETHARIIMEKFILRELIKISGQVLSNAYEDSTDVFDLLDMAGNQIYELASSHIKKDFIHVSKAALEKIEQIEEMRVLNTTLTGVSTGFKELDRRTSGWQPSNLVIVAARPAVGKTAFCLNLAINAASQSVWVQQGDKWFEQKKPSTPVGFFSLEMSNGELVVRMISSLYEIPMDNIIIPSKLTDFEYKSVQDSYPKFKELPIYLDDTGGLTMSELRTKARRMVDKFGVQLIVIDYLQLMQGEAGKGSIREQEISKISRELKALAKELSITVIALSQLNRTVEDRKEGRPRLSDLRESGAIEQDADMVGFLYQPTKELVDSRQALQPIMQALGAQATIFDIQKNRHGAIDMFFFRFVKENQRFIEYNPFTPNFNGDLPVNHHKSFAHLTNQLPPVRSSFSNKTEPGAFYNPAPESVDDLPF